MGRRRGGDPLERRLVSSVFLTGFTTFALLYGPQSILPLISDAFFVSPAEAGGTISAATAGIALGVLPWAFLSDRIGKARTLRMSAIGAVLLAAAAPWATHLGVLLTLRFLSGAALAAVPAVTVAFVVERLNVKAATAATGAFIAGNALGGLTGRLITAWVAEAFGWQAGMIALAVAGTIVTVVAVLLLPSEKPTDLDQASGGPSARERLAAAVSTHAVLPAYAQAFLVMGSFVAVYSYLGYRLESAPFYLSTAAASSVFLLYLLGSITSRYVSHLVARVGHRGTLLLAIGLMAIGMTVTVIPFLMMVVVGTGIFTVGYFMASPTAAELTARLSTVARAQVMAVYQLMFYIGISVEVWVLGLAYERFDWNGLVMSTLVIYGLASLAALAPPRRRPKREEDRP